LYREENLFIRLDYPVQVLLKNFLKIRKSKFRISIELEKHICFPLLGLNKAHTSEDVNNAGHLLLGIDTQKTHSHLAANPFCLFNRGQF
jgi:hypothetical protein